MPGRISFGGNWDFSLLGVAYKRWYGSKPYNRAVGGQGRRHLSFHPSTWSFHSSRRALGPVPEFERQGWAALFPQCRQPSTRSRHRARWISKRGIARERARIAPYSSWSGFVAAGYSCDLPMGFSVYIEPSFSIARYDQALIGFGRTRADSTQSLLLTHIKPSFSAGSFHPAPFLHSHAPNQHHRTLQI